MMEVATPLELGVVIVIVLVAVCFLFFILTRPRSFEDCIREQKQSGDNILAPEKQSAAQKKKSGKPKTKDKDHESSSRNPSSIKKESERLVHQNSTKDVPRSTSQNHTAEAVSRSDPSVSPNSPSKLSTVKTETLKSTTSLNPVNVKHDSENSNKKIYVKRKTKAKGTGSHNGKVAKAQIPYIDVENFEVDKAIDASASHGMSLPDMAARRRGNCDPRSSAGSYGVDNSVVESSPVAVHPSSSYQSTPKRQTKSWKSTDNFHQCDTVDDWSPSEHREQCVLFIDDSNLFIEGQKYYAKHLKLLVHQDFRCRIDIGKLLDLALHGRELYYGKLYGSEPPSLDTVWRKIREHLDVDTYHKDSKGKEKEVDTALSVDAVEYIHLNMEKLAYQTVIIVAGDRDYCPAVNKIIKRGWKVEIVAFSASISKALKSISESGPSECKIYAIEDLLKSNANTCCFVQSRWKFERGRPLPRDRTKVLIFRHPFNLKNCSEDIEMIRRLTAEITTLTRVPCCYHCGLNPKIIFVVGYVGKPTRLHSAPNESLDLTRYQQDLTNLLGEEAAINAIALLSHDKEAPKKSGSSGIDFFRIWKTKSAVIEQRCSEICDGHELLECLDILPFLQKPEGEFILKLENRFRPLPREYCGDENFDLDEYGDDYNFIYDDDEFPSLQCMRTDDLSDVDQENNDLDEGKFTKVERPLKPNWEIFSEPCGYGFCCSKGTKCPYKHSDNEMSFFKSNNNVGRIGYKSKPCIYFHHPDGKKNCNKGGQPMNHMCSYYHSVDEARCYICKKKGSKFIGHGSHDHEEVSSVSD